MAQLSHPYVTTGKAVALTRQIFASEVISLLFLILCLGLSQLSFQGASIFNFMAAVPVHSDFGAQENKICHCIRFPPCICREIMRPDARILVF